MSRIAMLFLAAIGASSLVGRALLGALDRTRAGVVIVYADDLGYADIGSFGGMIAAGDWRDGPDGRGAAGDLERECAAGAESGVGGSPLAA